MSYSKTEKSAQVTADNIRQDKSTSGVNDLRPVHQAALQRQSQMAESPTQTKQKALTQLIGPHSSKVNGSSKVNSPSKVNNTGLPDSLKSGVENLSGISLDNVKVHYNSAEPAQLNAHAFAQGTDIHVAPGQEQHLPHEAWHVVQQAQGRVKPTVQMNSDGGSGDHAIQLQKVINFDASDYADNLDAVYDPTQTHFSFLLDSEIKGGGAHMAQVNENLHITFQSADRANVAHYFYNSLTKVWRLHAYGPGRPSPYPPGDANLTSLMDRAIEFGWPSGADIVVKQKKVERTPEEIEERRIQGELKAKQNLDAARLKRETLEREQAQRDREYDERIAAEKLAIEKERQAQRAKRLAEEEQARIAWEAQKAVAEESKRKRMIEQEIRAKQQAELIIAQQAQRAIKEKEKEERRLETERQARIAREQKADRLAAREEVVRKEMEAAAERKRQKAEEKRLAQAAREEAEKLKSAEAAKKVSEEAVESSKEKEEEPPERDFAQEINALILESEENRLIDEQQTSERRAAAQKEIEQEAQENQAEQVPAQTRWIGPLGWVTIAVGLIGTVGGLVFLT